MCITLGYFAICKRNPKSSRLKIIGNLLAHITGKLEGGISLQVLQDPGTWTPAGSWSCPFLGQSVPHTTFLLRRLSE